MQREYRRPSGFEFYSWVFMRLSGVILLFIAVFHLLWMHFSVGLENITFEVIKERWTGPWGPFWRLYDLLLLVFALTHGLNGTRIVVEDYVRARGWQTFLKFLLYAFWFLFIGMGAYIIFAFQG